jgi:hypothetical protein
VTFCANFLRVSRIRGLVNSFRNLFFDCPIEFGQKPPVRGVLLRSSDLKLLGFLPASSHSAINQTSERPEPGREALSSWITNQLQWLGLGIRSAFASGHPTAIKHLDCAPSYPQPAALGPELPGRATQSCRGAKHLSVTHQAYRTWTLLASSGTTQTTS